MITAERIEAAFHRRFGEWVLSIDSHVGGEPARLILGGIPALPGASLNDRRLFFAENLDVIRRRLTCEPRGHRDMFASVLTPSESEGAAFGLIYMDTKRYPYLCGHATMAAVSALIELELIDAELPNTRVLVDTPSGPWSTEARVRQVSDDPGNRFVVDAVAVRPEIAFAWQLDCPLEVPDIGRLSVDVSFTGGFFVMVSTEQIGLDLTPDNVPRLTALGMSIIDAGNAQLSVRHPLRPYIDSIDVVEFFDPSGHRQGRGKNFVIIGEGHVDRSACGTGTCAKLALLHRRGELAVGQPFTNEGLMGTTFDAQIVGETEIAGRPAIIPEVAGKAYITGLHRFVWSATDPLADGFLI
jgi:proline racemase